jgi:hypothetical protein
MLGVLPFGVAFAQDATEPVEPAEGELEVLTTIGTITGDSATYYGQEITTEGIVEELLNVRTFVLGEEAAVFPNQLLVINNTGSEFDLQLVRGRQVRLVGTVYPSIDEGGMDQLISGAASASATDPMMEATIDPMAMETVEPGMEMTDEVMVEPTMTPENITGDMGNMTEGEHWVDFSLMTLPDEFNNYTIFVLNSLDTITYIEEQ